MTHFNPFPGLRPFEPAEDYLFFGRDGQSDELLRRLSNKPFLAVIGTSGSGKSSLVRAGLLPALYGGFMLNAGSTWRIALFRPGTDPIGNLADALSKSGVLGSGLGEASVQTNLSETTLRRSSLGLVDLVTQARMPSQDNLLIVVDQFEEIFRFKQSAKDERSEDDAAAFVKLLLEATRQSQVPVYVAITMRSDFLGDCAQFRDLPEAINEGQYLIPRMTRDQRRAAITGPIAVGGAEITARLMNRLLNDVGDNPDQLPILQHALMRTWQRWQPADEQSDKPKGPIDFEHYEAVGGMAEALSLHADKAYNELPDARHKKVAEKLFKCLTERGLDNREVRRPTKLNQICAIADATESEVAEVIEAFRRPGRSFLMPPTNVALTGATLIDISHESLIRGWQRLKDWVEEEAQSARTYRRLADTAALYDKGEAALWNDPNLRITLDWRKQNNPNETWADRYDPNFVSAMAFLDKSKAKSEADVAALALQQQREVRRARIVALVLAAAFIISTALAVAAFSLRNQAKASAFEANTARLAAEAQKKKVQQLLTQQTLDNQELATKNEEIKKERDTADGLRKAAVAEAALRLKAEQEATNNAHLAEQQKNIAREELKETIRTRAAALNVAVHMGKSNINTNRTLVELADKLLEVSPSDALRWRIYKAQALSALRQHSDVVAEYSKILSMEPNYSIALMNRGYTYTVVKDEGAPRKALQDLDEYLKLDPNSSLAYQNKAIALGQMKDYEGAEQSIEKAIEVFKRRSSETFSDNEISEDIRGATGFDIIASDEPALLTALHYHLANLQAFQGQIRFLESLKKTDRSRPKSLDAYLSAVNWAWLHMNQRPEDYGGLVSQGELWELAGYPKEALRSYEEFQLKHKEKQDKRYDNLANWVKQEIQNPQLRLRAAEKEDVRTLELKAKFWEESKLNIAEEFLTEALEQEPFNVDLWIHRAQVRNRKGEFPKSREDADKAFELAPNEPMTLVIRGLATGDLPDRKTNLRKALDSDPYNYDALIWLIKLEEDPREAVDLLNKAISRNPVSADLYYKKAVLQNTSVDHQAALKTINQAIALDSSNLDFYDERAKAETGLHRDQTEVNVNRADGYEEAAALDLRRGQPKEALDLYERCLNLLTAAANNQTDANLQSHLAAAMHQIARIVEGEEGSKTKAIAYLKAKFANRPELTPIVTREIEDLSRNP